MDLRGSKTPGNGDTFDATRLRQQSCNCTAQVVNISNQSHTLQLFSVCREIDYFDTTE